LQILKKTSDYPATLNMIFHVGLKIYTYFSSAVHPKWCSWTIL